MKNEFDKTAGDPDRPANSSADKPSNEMMIDEIMEIFSMIMHKAYKFPPDALAYKADPDDAGYLITFRHSSAADIEDPDIAASYDKDFYRDMRIFLQRLDELGSELEISPNQLAISAGNLLGLVDALALYFKDESCPVKIADNAETGITALPDKSPHRVNAALHHMAKDGHELARDNKDAYEYYMSSTPAQAFVSLDHYYASIAAKAKSDIPVSLDLLRQKILSTVSGDDSILPPKPQEEKVALEDTFMACARWHDTAPALPVVEKTPFLLQREVHVQLAAAIQSMLISNYGFAREISTGTVRTTVRPADGDFYHMSFNCTQMPEGKVLGQHFKSLHAFGENFLKAGGDCEGAKLLSVRDANIMTIEYYPETLLGVVTNMIFQCHPGNLMAQTHLRSIAHLRERLDLNQPANALH